MYKIEIPGCITTIIIFLLLIFIIKQLWWLIVGIIIILIIAYYANLIYKTIAGKSSDSEQQYNPQMGEVYKICPYCNAKVKVSASTCPICKHALN